MKKRVLMVAVLMGSLLFTSCLDDKESASVVGIRDAKAEQLKGLAALANAQAEATKIVGEAEAAIRNAEAEFKRQETDQAAQEFEIKLQQIIAEAEAAMLKAMLEAKQHEYNITAETDAEIARLYGEYATETGILAGLNSDLITETAKLAGLEAGILDAKAVVAKTIATNNSKIAEEKAKIAGYNALAEITDKASLYQAYAQAKTQNEEEQNVLAAAKAVQSTADNNLQKAVEPFALTYDGIAPLATVEAVAGLNEKGWVIFTSKKIEVKYSPLKYTLVTSKVKDQRYKLQRAVESAQKTLGAPESAQKPATGLYAALESAQNAYDTAVADYQADQDNEALRENMRNADVALAKAKENVSAALQDVRDAQADLAKFDVYVSAFSGTAWDEYEFAIGNLEKLQVVYDEASDNVAVAAEAVSVSDAVMTVALGLYNGTTDIELEILKCEAEIANLQKKNAELTDVEDATALLAKTKEEIETIKVKIELKKATIARIQAELKVLLG